MADFEFHVASFLEAQRMIREMWPSHIITALGKKDIIPSMGDHHLVLEFDDTEVIDPTEQWVAFTPEHLDRVLAFTADLQPFHRLLVHCRAGKSRSTAIMMGVLMQHGHSAEEAFQSVLDIRPVAIPNRHIVDLIDQRLETGGTLTEVVADYYKKLTIPGVHLPDRGGANL